MDMAVSSVHGDAGIVDYALILGPQHQPKAGISTYPNPVQSITITTPVI
jgi:hypothetical protein